MFRSHTARRQFGVVLALLGLVAGSAWLSLEVASGRLRPPQASALASLLLVVVTGAYVYVTHSLVVETRRARRRERAPAIDLEPDGLGPKVRNVGMTPAYDLELTFELVPADDSDAARETTERSRRNLDAGDWLRLDEPPFRALCDPEDAPAAYDELRVTGRCHNYFDEPFPVEKSYPVPFVTDDGTPDAVPPTEVSLSRIQNDLAELVDVTLATDPRGSEDGGDG